MNIARKSSVEALARQNVRAARSRWGVQLSPMQTASLREYSRQFRLSIDAGDLLLLDGHWYVTHTGLIRLARQKRCTGIQLRPVLEFSAPTASRWAFEATVFTSKGCKGFVGYGDADPSNTSDLVRGAEMRVAETRAVNRALRKAYGVGICSVEEIGSFSGRPAPEETHRKRPRKPANSNGANGQHRLRDRLFQLIRQHELDPILVKSYAIDFCGVKTLKEASRQQIEGFIEHVADWVSKDKNALICQLNSYLGQKAGAA